MNEAMKESLTKVISSELEKGMKVSVEVGNIHAKDIVALNVQTKGNGLSLVKMLIMAMAQNDVLEKVILAAAIASQNIEVEAIKIPAVPTKEKGGQR